MPDSLFDDDNEIGTERSTAPLAARMRPRNFDEYVGQAHLVGPGAAFRKAAEAGKLGSIILWGPPGVGKTTLAEIVAAMANAAITKISAVSAGVQDLRRIIAEARMVQRHGRRTILFIDEIHRFNKAQQDAILPVVEDGTITLIGATTENPSFEVNSALLSRSRVFVLNPLTDDEVQAVIDRALEDRARGIAVSLQGDAKSALVSLANGDARAALSMLELATATGDDPVTVETIRDVVQRRQILYDKGGEQHFDLISALHKSVRDSDVDASIYWLARMLEGGEEPLYIARRMVRMATEDIGLADPHALPLAIAAQQAVSFIGMPEGALALAECVAYLAATHKSNAIYKAYGAAKADVDNTRNDPVPMHLRNAATALMKDLGYGEGYEYAHDLPEGKSEQAHLPEVLAGRRYFQATRRGWESRLVKEGDPHEK